MINQWSKQGRRLATLWSVVAIWAFALMLWAVFNVIWFVLAIILALSLPAFYDLWRNPTSRISIWPARVAWDATLVNGDRRDIDHVRLDRRFDGSMKITLIHLGGAQTRLPPDITPPPDQLQSALEDAGIPVQRHPFTPF